MIETTPTVVLGGVNDANLISTKVGIDHTYVLTTKHLKG